MKKLFALCFLLFSANASAIYVDCTCSTNGDGSTTTCGASGPKNVAQTTTVAATAYFYARGTTCTLASTTITVAANNVVLGAYGAGADPIIAAGSTTYPLTLGASNDYIITNLDLRGGSTGAIVINGTSAGGSINQVAFTTPLAGIVANAAGITNLTLQNITGTCNGAASICVNIAANGGGVVFKNSTLHMMSNADRSSTSLIGLRLNGTATTVDNVTIDGGSNIPLEIRTTDSHIVRNSRLSGGYLAALRIRDSDSNTIEDNEMLGTWSGVAYPSGTGAGIDLIDISDACGTNIVRRNNIHGVYQGIVDQCDVGGGNIYNSNVIYDYRVNGISYQSDGAEGQIVNNTLIHNPIEGVGHAIVIQQGSATTKARIINNVCVGLAVGDNIQCISLPASAATGATYINNNDWYPATSGAKIGELDDVPYTTLATWQAALAGDVNTTGDDAQSIAADPVLQGGSQPTTVAGSKPLPWSPVCALGTRWATGALDYSKFPFKYPPSAGAYQCRASAR